MKYISVFFLAFALFMHAPLRCTSQDSEWTFDQFMQLVLANNLELIIEQYEVSAAQAAHTAAKVFEDPELEMIFPAFDEDEFSGFPGSIAFEMEIPIDIFGKRRNRIRQTRAEKHAAEAGLEDFLRFLRADAAEVFIDAVAHQRIVEQMQLTLDQLNQLIDLNQTLFEEGEIGEVDVMQTRLEARNFEAELIGVRKDISDLMHEVHYLIGGIPSDTIIFVGDIAIDPPLVDYDQLRHKALSSRPDIIMMERFVEASRHGLRKARAERFPEISLIAGYHNEGAISPSPGFDAAYAGVIIPLKFSGLNRGAFLESRIHYDMSKTMLDLTSMQAETELHNAWKKYLLITRKRMLFTESILQDAERVRDAIAYSYQQGEVSLLELLEAQRTMNEVYMNYYDTLAQYARSIVKLSKASGEWLVDFD